jgi:hypothetical protein
VKHCFPGFINIKQKSIWIDGGPVISLPMPPNESRLRIFSLTMGLFFGLLGGIITLLIHKTYALPAALLFFASVFGLLFFFDHLAYVGYTFWNKTVYYYSRLARGWISVLILLTLFLVGLTGSRIHTVPMTTKRSMWVKKDGIGGSADAPRYFDDTISEKKWIGTYFQWIKETKSWWAVFLIPLLMITDMLKSGTYVPSIPRNTYTLY